MKRICLKLEHYKPKLFVINLLFAVPFILGSGCSTDVDLEEGPVPFEVLRSVMSEAKEGIYKCSFNYQNIQDPDSNSQGALSGLELVIDSQTEFNTYISCDDTVSVNFEEEFVLAGMTTIQPTQVRIKEQAVELANDSLYLQVGLINTYLTTPSSAEYIIKVLSKDYFDYPVVFDIYWINMDWN